MCGGVHYGEVEGLASVERWSCSRGASCVLRVRNCSPYEDGLVPAVEVVQLMAALLHVRSRTTQQVQLQVRSTADRVQRVYSAW